MKNILVVGGAGYIGGALTDRLKGYNLRVYDNLLYDNVYRKSEGGISASSISQVTRIPRPTCIRKLNILVNYGTLIKDEKSKQYYLNHLTENRTRNILTKENVVNTVNIFSEYLAVVLNAMIQNEKIRKNIA